MPYRCSAREHADVRDVRDVRPVRDEVRGAVRACVLLAFCACSTRAREGVLSSGLHHTVQVWLTTSDRAHLLERQPDIAFSAAESTTATLIDVDTARRFQTMAGFGAALTDASASLIQTRLAPPQREALLQELFGRKHNGVGFSVVRLPIGASDFSRTHYSLDDMPAGMRDDAMAHFSITPYRADVLPVMQRAIAINRQLTVIATPWSAPAWMKSSNSLITGALRTDAYPAFAEYLRRYVSAFASEGVPIAALTVQNEPHNEPKDYPGMRFSAAARADFIGHHLGPLFAARGMHTQILDWDHNWDEPQSPLDVLRDSVARRFVSGVAWHCYAGDVSAQSRVHDAFPDKDAWFTECAGGAWAPNFGDNLRWNVRTLIIGATRHWARGVTLWNLALDEHHGPRLGGCNDCRGVLTIDSATGTVTRNEEFYALAHASRFVRQGAVRIASTSGADDVSTVAFRNGDDGSIVLLAVNDAALDRVLCVRMSSQVFVATIPAQSVVSFHWR